MKNIKRFLLVIFCAVCALTLSACDQNTATDVVENASKTYFSTNADNNETELEENKEEEVVEENTEEVVEEDKATTLAKEIISENNIKEDELENVKAIVNEVIALEFEDAKTKLVSLALYYNASLTLDDVKDLSDAVLNALCDKTKVVTISYKDYVNALNSLNEEFADLDELEVKVYELANKLLEDITDEEFDEVCAELKAAKAELKIRTAEYETALEELNTLYASVINAEKEDKGGHNHHNGGHGNHNYGGHHDYYFDYDFEDYFDFDDEYYFDFDDEDFEDYFDFDDEDLEDYFDFDDEEFEDFIEKFFNDFFGDYEEPEVEENDNSAIVTRRFF